ncbi:MAG: hypothetical protein ACK56F_09930 [bacterium]
MTKETIAVEIRHARLWDRKNLNLTGCFEKSTGNIFAVIRLSNGDRSELEPLPEEIANNTAVARVKVMNALLD